MPYSVHHEAAATAGESRTGAERRRVLMISYAFPPAGGSGVQRTAKFAKFLPEFGWRPTVWSTKLNPSLPHDQTLLDDLPPTLDHRTRTRWDVSTWPHYLAKATHRWMRRISGRNDWGEGIAWRSERRLASALKLLAPDEDVCWALGSFAPLLRLIRREKIDAIYSTSSPVSDHLVAWLLSRATRRPWVADFRDLWTDEYRYRFADGHRLRRALDRSLERRLLRDADAVLAVSASQMRALAERADVDEPKFFTITNGVDLDDFRPAARHAQAQGDDRSNRFVLTYAGRFTSESVSTSLIEGLERFAALDEDRKQSFEMRHVGQCSAAYRRRLANGKLRWSSRGYVAHHEAVAEMRRADVLLLALSDHPMAKTIVTGKIYEYLGAGRPILFCGPRDSEAARLVRSCDAGVVCGSDSQAVCEALGKFWTQWSRGRLPSGCPPERLQPFTRRHLTGRLAAILDGALNRSRVAFPIKHDGKTTS